MLALIHAEPKRVSLPQVRTDLATLDRLASEDVAVFVFSDVRPLAGAAGFLDWRLCGALSRALEKRQFSGELGESMLAPCRGRLAVRRVFVFGLGAAGECNQATFAETARRAHEVMSRAGSRDIVFLAPAVRRRVDVERAFVRAVSEELPGQVAQLLVESVG